MTSRHKAKEDTQAASVSAEEHQKRATEAERRLQSLVGSLEEQLRAREVDLSAQRAATSTADQRAATLEASLHQANAAAASMASRITETVAEAASQVQLIVRSADVRS